MDISIDGVDKAINYEKMNKPVKKNLPFEKNINKKESGEAIEKSLDVLGVNGKAGILYKSKDSYLHQDDPEYMMLEYQVEKAMENYSKTQKARKAGIAAEEDCEYYRSKLEEAQSKLDEYKKAKRAKLLEELSD